MTATTISVSYNTEKHPAMARLACESNRSEIVRDAVAQYYERHNGATLDDVLWAIERLEQTRSYMVCDNVRGVDTEPEMAALALEELGL